MLDQVFLDHLWVVLGVWTLLYCSDYALTIVCARMYHGGVSRHVELETFDLTPYFQEDIARLRWISPRFLLMLLAYGGVLAVLWTIQASRWIAEESAFLSVFARHGFWFAWGAAVLVELAIHLRHLTNLVLFAHIRSSDGVTGKLSYRAWLSYRISAAQLVGFAVLYSVCALLGNVWFFAGGAFKCSSSPKHRRLASRRRADDVASEVVVEAVEENPKPADTDGRNEC
jgi:hypothetical protein